MSEPLIGYYVHYHGLGHKHRCEAILSKLGLPCAVLTSRIADQPFAIGGLREVIDLACDIDGVPPEGAARSADVPCFHYAPLWTPTCTRRVAQFTRWCDERRPALLIVDVSVEITLLARLAAVPTIVVRQHGDRRDAAHEAAYRSAQRLLAPFPEQLEDDLTPDWVRDKTDYTAAFCRGGFRPVPQSRTTSSRLKVAVMAGRGGAGLPLAQLCVTAASRPEWDFVALGDIDVAFGSLPSNLRVSGWVADPAALLAGCDVVATAAGHNSVMEVAASGASMVAIAEPRPFDEQHRKCAILEREGLAVCHANWPDGETLGRLIAAAAELDRGRWVKLFGTGDGAADAAAAIRRVLRELPSPRTEVLETACGLSSVIPSQG